MKRLVLAAAFASLCLACEDSTVTQAVEPETDGMEEAVPAGKPMLPAWQTEEEKRDLGKADQYSDYKDANPSTYGITQPPSEGVRPVAEWEEAQALLLSYSSSDLPTTIRNNIADMAVLGLEVGSVYVIYDSATSKSNLTTLINNKGGNAASVHWLSLGNDSIWMRDFGPINIVSDSGKVALLDLRYYPNRVYDDAIPTLLSPSPFNVSVYRVPLDYEGGNFMADTQGNCFASEGLLEAQAVSESVVRTYMAAYFGCKNLYIASKLNGEGTTHIDMQSKIVDDNTIIVSEYVNGEGGYNVSVVDGNAEYFESLGYTVLRFPFPDQDDGVWRTYTNSLFFNGVNMWPVYSINSDRQAQALAVWQQALPTYNHEALNSDEIITWGGAMHCISQTIGANTLAKIESPAYACNGAWDCNPTVACTPNCTGKVCGDNGCGGSCGTCGANQSCNASGQCVACTPNCTGKQCGSNGCGGTCGTCADGLICNTSFQCVENTITECPGSGTPLSNDCGDYTDIGCCDGSGRLIYCYQNYLYCVDCTDGMASCGWESGNQWYDCNTAGSADPTGANPMSCDGGTTCTPNCTGKVCGSDGCGGSCGSCASGKSCNAAGTACVDGGSVFPTECLGLNQPSGNDCGVINDVGCCTESGWVLWCDGGALYCLDCTEGPSCGWDSDNSFYNCGTTGTEDPSGSNPLSCDGGTTCTPACTGKACGDDGCGGVCGTCSAGKTCTNGQCVTSTCTPNCVGRECGDDGCGGVCGTCNAGETCTYYQCVPSTCTPNCTGKECGADGCDGVCGTCGTGESCSNGTCIVGSCTPSCAGIQCGSDGCDGSCGACGPQQTCQNGQCVQSTCTPACTGKECGDDGCGGTCGACAATESCQNGTCVENTTCTPACVGRVCGPDGCGGVCGTCDKGFQCSDGNCIELACTPACGGMECGDDGCGGNCGLCGLGLTCEEGVCVDPDAPTCPANTVWDGKNCVLTPGVGDSDASGGCTTTTRSTPASALVLLSALLALALLRRVRS